MIRAAALAVALFATAAFAGGAVQDYTGLPPDLAAQARVFDAARISGDGKMLDDVLADDFVLVNGSGDTSGKAQFIRDYTDPDFHILPFCIEDGVKKVWGGGAVLGGKLHMRFVDHGKHEKTNFRFSDVWARRDGKWQLIYEQVTRLKN